VPTKRKLISPDKLERYLAYLFERVYYETEDLSAVSAAYEVAIRAVSNFRLHGAYGRELLLDRHVSDFDTDLTEPMLSEFLTDALPSLDLP